MPTLAIVIPYYKAEFFEQCLKSLADQTNKNFNVYIGDDCSPNSPDVILNQFKNQLVINYHRFDSNLGSTYLTQQWDRCIDLIQDEKWIMLIGDDDELSENVVEDFYNSLDEINNKNIQVVRANVTEIDGDNKVLREFVYPRFELSTSSYIKKIVSDYHITLPEYIFSVSAYKKYGFVHFPFAFGSDNIAWLEFSEGKEIFTLPNGICYMRLSNFNISGDKSNVKDKVFAKYLTHQYIIKNLFNYFDVDQQKIVIEKGYKYLLFSDSKNYKERFSYLLRVKKNLNLNEIKTIFFS